jgi:hypothetical protein
MRLPSLKLRHGLWLSLLAILGVGAAAHMNTQSSAFQGANIPALVTQPINEANLTALRGNIHALARPQFDRGAAPDSRQVNRVALVLRRSQDQENTLQQFLNEQQTKDSPNYHAWMTPRQFGAQFGPAQSDIQAVTGWLQSHGLQIGHVAAGNMFIEFTGTVGQIRSAFHTDIHRFMVNGQERFANVSDPQVPAALSPVIAGVTSLHNFPRHAHSHIRGAYQRFADTKEVEPLFTTTSGCGTSGNAPCYALGPADFQKIYNFPGLTGTGQTIAIVNDSNINMSDVQAFRNFFGITNPTNLPTVILNGPDPGVQGPNSVSQDEGEAVLDVELSGGLAPNATIDLVLTEPPNTLGAAGVDLSALYIVEHNLAPVMSESFGDCELNNAASNAYYSTLWQQAAAQGITAMASTGDSGSAACDGGAGSTETSAANGLAVSGIASTPYNVAVGGTDFNDASNPLTYWTSTSNNTTGLSAKSYIPETTWNDSCAATATAGSLGTCTTVQSDGSDLVGGAGGSSTFSTTPPWQMLVNSSASRELPDISFFASDGLNTNNFYIVCEADEVQTASDSCATTGTAEFVGVGGTSASSPAFAAIMALVNENQAGVGTGRQGNANYILYQLYHNNPSLVCTSNSAAVSNGSCLFYDIVTGNNSVACTGGTTDCSNTSGASNQYGVLVDPSHTNTPAWTTATGYDRATGLGSLNVANLITKWSTATLSSATPAITVHPVGTITHGANANFTITVTQGSGTTVPTGSVSLIAEPLGGAQVAIGPFALTPGTTDSTATISTVLLPGGGSVPTPYPVVATYSGDGTFAPANSLPVNVTVGEESSKTAVSMITYNVSGVETSSNATTAVYGSPYILRVDVTNSAGQSCSSSVPPVIPCPTGTITLTDNGSALNDLNNGGNQATLNNEGFLEDQPVQLPVGNHSIVASYGGDSSFTSSSNTSSPDNVSITQATTATSVSSSATEIASGTSVTLTATVATNSSGLAPSGTVQFQDNGTNISGTVTYTSTNGSASASASYKATLTTSLSALPPGFLQRPKPTLPLWPLLALASALALFAYMAIRMAPERRRAFAYAALLLFCVAATGLTACGGGGSGGGVSPHTDTITANYSGDTNYSSSSGQTSVSVQ